MTVAANTGCRLLLLRVVSQARTTKLILVSACRVCGFFLLILIGRGNPERRAEIAELLATIPDRELKKNTRPSIQIIRICPRRSPSPPVKIARGIRALRPGQKRNGKKRVFVADLI